MAFCAKFCACCGSTDGIEEHHLYLKADGCPDDLTVYLCHVCHGKAHGMARRINLGAAISEGMARAKAQGKRLGKPAVSEAKVEAVRAELARGTGLVKAARLHGVGTYTAQRIKKEMV